MWPEWISHLRPLFGNEVEEVVLEVSLDDDLVIARDRRAARELLAEELGSHLQLDAYNELLE